MSNVATGSTSDSLLTVDKVKKLNSKQLNEYLRRRLKDTKNINKHADTITVDQEVDGSNFLDLTRDDLLAIKIPLGPVKDIEKVINEIKGEQPVAGHIRTRSPSLSNEDSVTLKRKKRLKEYHDTVSIGLEANSPSVGANPEKFFKEQQITPILNGRPLANTGPPIALYNEAFSIFLNDFSNDNLKIPSDFLKWTDKLILEATNNYGNEEERNEKMRDILSEKLGTILLVEYGTKRQKCKSDGVIMTLSSSLNACGYLVILEGKNEIGTGKNDPTIQGALYYRDYWSQKNVKTIRDCCCAPSFIITMAGPWFCILGGVFLSKAVVEPLTDLIPLTINLRAFDKKKRIARLFYSLSRALTYLDEFYQNLTLEKSLDHRFFPYVRHFQSDGNNTISFTYVCELLDDPTRTIWKGTHEDGRSIVIKYTSKYCATAHNICANAGFAPGLLYCSDNAEAKRFGGFRMIIIEYIDGITLDQRFDEDTIDASYRLYIYRDVKSAIIALHKENFVFADLRFPNILIFETVDEMHANLIDFDWCGKHNVDSYPSSMNEDIPWPPGAEPDALLKKAHDLYWLNVLRMFFNLREADVTNEALSISSEL